MPLDIDLSQLHPIAKKILGPDAPERAKATAAKGVVLGAPPDAIVTIVAALTEDENAELRQTAEKTLREMKPQVLDAALAKPLQAPVLEVLRRLRSRDEDVIEKVLANPGVSPETVLAIAKSASESIAERIATNEQRLLEHPEIIEALYQNEQTRSSTADRIVELAIRNGIELDIPAFAQIKAALANELIAEPSEEPTPDDLLYKEVTRLAQQVDIDPGEEDTHVVDEDGSEKIDDKCAPLWVQLSNMTPAQKIRRALLGSSTERLLLVRDTNRLVAEAAIRSPRIKQNEVVKISASRSVSEEVLRIIAKNREWVRNPQIKYNLVTNPRTPFAQVLPLLPYMRDHQLRSIAKSKNVPSNVAQAARNQLAKRHKK